MRAKIFSFVKMSDTSVVASVRIARHVAKVLKMDIVDTASIGDEKDLDVLLVVNGAFSFCKHLAELGQAVVNARRVVWIQNDYTIIPPKEESGAESPFRRAFRDRKLRGMPPIDYWTTVQVNVTATPRSHYVNWNCLTFDTTAPPELLRLRLQCSSPTLLYYGSHRAGRTEDFDRYLRHPEVKTLVSSPSPKFAEIYRDPKIHHLPKIEDNLHDFVGRQGLGLYIEDRRSHSEFHSPANRFYEMLSAGLPMVFQPECGTTMRQGGYDTQTFAVGNAKAVARAMERRKEIREQQRAAWLPRAQRERADLDSVIKRAWQKVQE